MNMAITVSQVLRIQGAWLLPSALRQRPTALEIMADRDVGALPVIDEGKLVGIFFRTGLRPQGDPEGKIVEEHDGGGTDEQPAHRGAELTLQDCMVLMTSNHIRHLPVWTRASPGS